jgi:hypothetical protein
MIDLLNKEFTISQMSLRFQSARESACVCEREKEREETYGKLGTAYKAKHKS